MPLQDVGARFLILLTMNRSAIALLEGSSCECTLSGIHSFILWVAYDVLDPAVCSLVYGAELSRDASQLACGGDKVDGFSVALDSSTVGCESSSLNWLQHPLDEATFLLGRAMVITSRLRYASKYAHLPPLRVSPTQVNQVYATTLKILNLARSAHGSQWSCS
jgi:hypothetical protein